MNKSNIVLIGFMGCGKSTIGRALSEKTGFRFMDTDQLIEHTAGMTIPHIFLKYGEQYFRMLEYKIIRAISENPHQIIATGGGIIKNPDNIQMLAQQGSIIYLKTSPEQIFSNIQYDETRPLLQGENKIEKIRLLLTERIPLYEKYQDYTVDVTNLSVEEVVDHILEL